LCLALGFSQCRQEYSGEDGNDRDHNQSSIR
jgi:hypothetical protein